MKLTQEDIKLFMEFIAESEEFRPVVNQIIDVIKSYGPELDRIMDTLITHYVQINSDSFFLYLSKGFSREEAMMLILNTNISLQESVKSNIKRRK